MPAYNAVASIRQAIASVLRQRGPTFEFLIIDDGSADDTCAVVRSYRDDRIRLVRNANNQGVAASLNLGIELARGRYILRMDADDICFPSRFAAQFLFMEENPEIGISGTWIRLFGDQPPVVERAPVGCGVMKAYLLFGPPIFHPTAILRKEALDRHGLRYDPRFHRTEDYDLWLRATDFFPLGNISAPFLRFRCHAESVSATASNLMRQQACALQRRALLQIGAHADDAELDRHYQIAKGFRVRSLEGLRRAEEWLNHLVRRNRESGFVAEADFLAAAGMVWCRLCANSAQLGTAARRCFLSSPLSAGVVQTSREKVQFLISILYHESLAMKKKLWR
jgi:glycosyltransferase involved in cell wall biosynthesis